MGEMRRKLFAGALLAIGLAGPAVAGVSLRASRTDVFYSSDAEPDCKALFAITDDTQLPANVSRIHAVVDGAPAGATLAYHWAVKGDGIVAADLDLGTGEETPTLIGMCGAFGNACILTEDRLRFYNEPSLLWLGPTCAALPKDTSKPFRGSVAKITLKVTAGKKRVGRATLNVGWGRVGSVTLFVDGEDGLGKKSGIGTGVLPFLSATVAANPALPGAVTTFEFSNGAGQVGSVGPGCGTVIGGRSFDACIGSEEYQGSGKFVPVVEAQFADKSALCDNATVQVLNCSAKAQLDVITKPKLAVYDPGDARRSTVDVLVRMRNLSVQSGTLPPCSFLMAGAGILTCSASLKVGGATDTKITAFDLPHCSEATDRGCQNDADCRPPFCPECTIDETCLTRSHCSKTDSKLCTSDAECGKIACPICVTDEICIRVLDLGGASAIVIPPGKSFDLLHETVQVKNKFADTGSLTDVWTASTVNAGSADHSVKYKIRGRPDAAAKR
jgi:hypothetical protein